MSLRRFSPKSWQATFILPRTGQRLKGRVNLRSPSTGPGLNGSSHDASDDGSAERRSLLTGEIQRDDSLSHTARAKLSKAWQLATSEPAIAVLKCTLAYVLGSLATFVPAIAAFLAHGQHGHPDGSHLVATVTVYFHPARSRGSMIKALACALLAFLYAAFVSLTSMCVSMFFQDTLHARAAGHALVLVLFVGGGLGFVGWTKHRLADPLVNVACSLACLSTITVLTKEGAVQAGDLSFAKIGQVLKMVVLGVAASMAVSFVVFPVSARKKLRGELAAVTESVAVMLGVISEAFLRGSEGELAAPEFVEAAGRHRAAYASLDGLLREAKLEHLVAGTEKEYRLEKVLARQVQDITHNLGGLRGAAALQFQLLREARVAGSQDAGPSGLDSWTQREWSFYADRPLEPINEQDEDGSSADEGADHSFLAADIFSLFINRLGPSMRSLAFTLSQTFKEIPFGPPPDYKVTVNSRLGVSLSRAIALYRTSRETALSSIYRQKDVLNMRDPEALADLEEVSASCGHFSFSLLEFSEQLREVLAVLDELQLEAEERPKGRSWNWLKFWRREPEVGLTSDESDRVPEQPVGNGNGDDDQLASRPNLPRHYWPWPRERLGYRIWKSLRVFRRDDTKFAIKVGTGAALYALPAFLPSTRPVYSHWKGEWGLLSYMLVCSVTIGSSNTTGYARFLGTSLGALCAIVAWYVAGGNVYALAFLGFVMAAWTFCLILIKGQGPMGRFIMLTYNLSVLYAYSQSQNIRSDGQRRPDYRPIITEIALHRVVAVLSGCIWGVIITRLIWPISARRRLKHSLSLLWLRMSLIWKRDPLSTMVQTRVPVVYMTTREKLEIERFVARIESFRTAARSEFGLKRAFPDALYSSLIQRTRTMVDAFHAMNLALMNNESASDGEIAVLRYTAAERQHLSARISHLLSVAASSMKLEYPMSDVLPNIEHARDRLLARISRFRQDGEASRATVDEDYALLYSYILVTGQISKEIMEIMEGISGLFGMLDEEVVRLV